MIQVQNRQRRVRFRSARLRRAAEHVLRDLGVADRPASLVLVTDRAIQALNRDFRGRDEPTNVLAFAEAEDSAPELFEPALGDVIISLETARREAADAAGVPEGQVPDEALFERVLWLTVHGLLHLVGHDHRDDAEEARMEAEASRLLGALRRTFTL